MDELPEEIRTRTVLVSLHNYKKTVTCLLMDKLILENIYKEISRVYNTDFLENLIKIPEARVFLFGGMVRDLILAKEWKDIDIRMTINKSLEEREKLVEEALKKISLCKKVRLGNIELTVYRFWPNENKETESIDLSLSPSLEHGKADFTMHNVFVDLKTGEIIDMFGGVNDLENKTIRTTEDPLISFKKQPEVIFRAIGFACQLNYSIESNTYNGLKRNTPHILETLEFINANKTGLETEAFIDAIFRGLRYDPNKYFYLINETGVLSELLKFLSLELNLDFDKTRIQEIHNIFPKKSRQSFEDNLSIFINFLAHQLSKKNEQKVAQSIKDIFNI